MKMRKSPFIFFSFILILISITHIKTDLPIHCVKHQINGKWTLMKSDPVMTGDGQLPCGHSQPDKEQTSYQAYSEQFKSTKSIPVQLNHEYTVIGENGKSGKWTMIYDEGFEIDYDNTKYFAFNKYQPSSEESGGYVSDCAQTLVGWYHDFTTGDRGCYKAQKEGVASDITQNVKQDKVVQPKSEDLNKKIVQPEQTDLANQPDIIYFVQENQQEEDKLKLHKDSKEHEKVVNRLNLVQKSWTAKVPENFKDLTLQQMNKRAGRKKYHSFLQVNAQIETSAENEAEQKDVLDIPSSFSWEQYIQPTIAQHDCGSCYALATMEMLQSRIKIKFNDPIKLSIQESLDCNYYNQGCDGGYGFLVSKYFTENQLVSDECYPYTAQDGQCYANKCENKNDHYYKVSDYQYIGGGYGFSNEQDMLKELYANGPIVASFEPGMDFMYYEKGVYSQVKENQYMTQSEALPEWEKVDHSILIYGWGETQEGERYWLCQNSWGENWGENGRFKMKRGVDESHIESMGEAATLVKHMTNQKSSFLETENKTRHLKKNN